MSQTDSLKEHQQALFVLLQEFDRICKALDIPYVLFAGTMLGAVRHGGFIPWDDDLDVLMFREDYERFLREAETILNQDKFYLQKSFSDHWPMFFSKLRLNGTTCLEKYHPRDLCTHQGIYMDIFPCDNAAKTELGRRLQFMASKVVIAKALYQRGYETDSRIKKLFMTICRLLPMGFFRRIACKGKSNSQYVHSFFAAASGYSKNVYPREVLSENSLCRFEKQEFPIPADFDYLLTQLYGQWRMLPRESERKQKQHAILVDTQCGYEHYLHYRDGMQFSMHTRSIR